MTPSTTFTTGLLLIGLGGTALAGGPTQFVLTQTDHVDLSSTADPNNPEYIGSNPSAVTWAPPVAYVAGFNNSGSAGNTGIVPVGNLGGGSTPVFGNTFGVRTTPALRGYSGLDTDFNSTTSFTGVLAAFDEGAAAANGIARYDLSSSSAALVLVWGETARGGSGVAYDPGPGGNHDPAGSGVAWTTFGSGRRALNDLATGAAIYTTSDGMIINGAGTGTFWRDMDFNDATGDIWLREGNNVIRATRTGNNSITATTLVVDELEADFVAGQNIAYLQGMDAVIYNERSSTSAGQSFFSSVRIIDENGNNLAADWGSYAPADSSGYYDFSYDRITNSLAILDFANRTLDIFDVTRVNTGSGYCYGDGTGAACPCSNNGAAGEGCVNSTGNGASLVGSGNASISNDQLALNVNGAPTGNFGIFYQGDTQASNPMGDGLMCANVTKRYQVQVVDAFGTASRTGFGAFAQAGQTAYYQFWFRDVAGSACGGNYNFSNAWQVNWEN